MSFKFKSDDTFLINRNNISYTITAAEAKDIVNPEGVLIPPTIEATSSGDFINGQGLPVESEKIKLVRTTGTDVNMKLTTQNSLTELDKIDSFPNDIESDEYIPITTSISNIESTGNQYTFTFLAVNYDIGLFSVGDFVKGNGQYKGEITDITDGKMTVQSDDEGWKLMNNKRIEYNVKVQQ